MDIQLSISLLASSRMGSLERCLDSLRPLLSKVPSELIVVFTGTDERVREIAARYTDHIIPFSWRDDFSAARNAGLKEAKGEWLLYIDDDEWFEDTEEICTFFLSGEYRRYSSARYVQRNYLNWSGTEYMDYHALRMARRTSGLHFEGPIHEELILAPGEARYFGAYVHHYGYVKDLKTGTMKTSRNIPLLLEAIEAAPARLKNYIQITREYCIEGNWDEAERWCREGRKIVKGMRGAQAEGWLQVYLLRILCKKADKAQAAREAEAILRDESPCELASLLIYILMIELYAGMGSPKDAVRWGVKFEGLLRAVQKKPEWWARQELGEFSRSDVETPEKLAAVWANVTACALKAQDSENVRYFLARLPWGEKNLIQPYYSVFDEWKQKYGAKFSDLLLELPYDTDYLLLQKARAGKDRGFLKRCLQEAGSPYLQQQALREAMRFQEEISSEDISAFISRIDLKAWEACAEGALAGLPYAEIGAARAMAEKIQQSHPLQALWLERIVRERALSREYLNGKALMDALNEYFQCVQDYYRAQYRDDMFEGERLSLLPKDCRFALMAQDALAKIDEGASAEGARLFTETISLYPPLAGVVREAIRQVASSTDAPDTNAGASDEFAQLAVQMKEAVQGIIANRQHKEALAVIEQLLPLLPNDLDILKLRQKALRGSV